jgi:hypothetical protein
MKEFIVSDLLKLKLENNKTYIYINNVKILQCKYLLLNELVIINENKEVNTENLSIDAQTKNLDHSLELLEEDEYVIPPDVEFWAHSSNLQAWYEHSYNTQLLHSNLAFPLLRKLSQAGDITAKKVFKEEIKERFREGNLNVMIFLVIEGYLDELDIEESDDLYQELDFETYKNLQKGLKNSTKKNVFII